MKTLGFFLFILFIALMVTTDIILGTYYLKDFRGITREEVSQAFSGMSRLDELFYDIQESW